MKLTNYFQYFMLLWRNNSLASALRPRISIFLGVERKTG